MTVRTKTDTPSQQVVRPECFMLCDYAVFEHGKFTIAGGGWERVIPEALPQPYGFYIATKLAVPREQATGSMELTIRFTDAQGVVPAELQAAKVNFSPELDDGPPEVTISLVFRAQMTLIAPGRFGVHLLSNGDKVAETYFRVGDPSPKSSEEPGL